MAQLLWEWAATSPEHLDPQIGGAEADALVGRYLWGGEPAVEPEAADVATARQDRHHAEAAEGAKA